MTKECLPVTREYWRHHLRAPFADFEGERARELAETKAQFRPWPPKSEAPQASTEITEPEPAPALEPA